MSRPNFVIVEQKDTFDQESFNKDYMNLDYSKKYLMKKYDLTEGLWKNKSRTARKETGFTRLAGKRNVVDDRYITRVDGGYRVQKKFEGFSRSCGTYSDLKTARIVRDILLKCDWKPEIIEECRRIYHNKENHANQFSSSILKNKALEKYEEFKRMFLSGEYSYNEILDALNFTRHMYNVCHNKLKIEAGYNIRKKMVKNHD